MRALLEREGWEPETVSDVCVAVSEVVTNALRHGAGVGALHVELVGDRVRVSVGDQSASRPRARRAGPDEPGGRGLVVLDALSDAWGVDPLDGAPERKRVWFEVRRPNAAGAP